MGNDVAAAARLVVLSDVDVPIQDDGEPQTDVADLHQRLARTIRAGFAKAAHTLDLGGRQNRKQLVTPGGDNGRGGNTHGKTGYRVWRTTAGDGANHTH